MIIESVGPRDKFTDRYVKDGRILIDPKRSKRDYVTALIIQRMMDSDTTFVLKGDTVDENIANLKNHIDARKRVLENAAKKKFRFSGDADVYHHTTPNCPAFKDAPQVFFDSVNNPKTSLGCLEGTELMIYTAIGVWDFNLLGERPVDEESDFIPGDWGYIYNDAFNDTWKPGLEGENVIYEGYLGFWGHFAPGNTYQSLNEWMKDIKSWNSGQGRPRIDGIARFPMDGLDEVKPPKNDNP
jgi:hypothetical protein